MSRSQCATDSLEKVLKTRIGAKRFKCWFRKNKDKVIACERLFLLLLAIPDKKRMQRILEGIARRAQASSSAPKAGYEIWRTTPRDGLGTNTRVCHPGAGQPWRLLPFVGASILARRQPGTPSETS